MNVFVFDIETVPDVATGRAIHGLDGLSDEEIAAAMLHLQRQKTGRDFLPHYLHRIVAISVVFRFQDQLKVWSLGDEESDEEDIVRRFFDGIDKYTPNLVSWNGGGFDLPVLHYRALKLGVSAPQYWDTGGLDQGFKWNNYLSRYHARHLDLMDLLAMYTGRANAPLDDIATMLGFPGKMGMSGSKVWDQFRLGDIKSIRDYCETDVLNTYLVYLAFEKMRGNLDQQGFAGECDRLRITLKQANLAHFDEFLSHWSNDN